MQIIKGGITAVEGFSASGLYAGIKKNGQPDLALIFSESPCAVAGVFTRNRFKAPPLLLDKIHLRTREGQAIIVNSGNANAFTGDRGFQDAETMVRVTADVLGIPRKSVYVASTGVIGEFLPIEKVMGAIPELAARLTREGGHAAAEAIMTTDTFPKEIAVVGRVGRDEICVGGMAKGSGMIHPNMATMLAFLSTDVTIDPRLLQGALQEAVGNTFHCITVDGETSTNDMVLVLASGRSQSAITTKGKAFLQFVDLLSSVCLSLGKMIVKDGEGATKMIQIEVVGAVDNRAAAKIAKGVACSNLVKTAFFGEDANWGRIVAAIGNAGVPIDPTRIDLAFCDNRANGDDHGGRKIFLLKQGLHQGKNAESEVASLLKQGEIRFLLDFHSGRGKSMVWTSDLSLDYVKINASYRS